MIELHKGIIRFNDKITKQSVEKLMNKIAKKLKKYKQIVIYFTSSGGTAYEAYTLVDYMNMNKSRITLKGTWSLLSAGFDIFLLYRGEKELIRPVYGCAHLMKLDIKKYFTLSKKKRIEQKNHHNFLHSAIEIERQRQ